MADQEPDAGVVPPSGTPQAQTRQDKQEQANRELAGDADTARDPYVAALLDERSRARDDQHRKEIDAELKARGYTEKTKGGEPGDGEHGDGRDDEAAKAARARADAGGDKTEPPKNRATRGKQTS